MANGRAQISAASLPSKLYVSVQVETAWSPSARPVRRHRQTQRFPIRRPIGLSIIPISRVCGANRCLDY